MPPSFKKSSQSIDLVDLETFILVSELGSFSATAALLHVSQSSVSTRVKRLETMLETPLLLRNSRKVSPTEDGERLIQGADRALAGLRGVVGSLLDVADQARQRVVIASTPILAATVLPPLIRDYAARFTDVEVQLLDLSYTGVLDALDSGIADVAVVSDIGDGRFRSEPLGSDAVVLVIPPNHVLVNAKHVTLEELVGETLIVVDLYQPIRDSISAAMREKNLPLPRFISVSNLGTLLGMLNASMGMALMARKRGLRRQSRGDGLAIIDELELRRNYTLLFPRKAEVSTSVQSFCTFLRGSLAGHWPDPPFPTAV
jgi:LysR family transcriptional regulator, carnitine catabolism transcriptional activator